MFQWRDGPGADYPAHHHPTDNTYYIQHGDIEVTYPQLAYTVRHYRQGDRFSIPAALVHSAVMGQQGCVFIIGSKRVEKFT